MAKPIAINLLLLDGTTGGRIKCSINGRTGMIFKIPRKDLVKCHDRTELKNNGVYFLRGKLREHPTVYVGHSTEGLFKKLNEHDARADENFWTEALVFITSDNSFNATEIIWLENEFYNTIKDAGNSVYKTGSSPALGNVTEEKEIELKDHADFAQLMLSAMGYKMFEPLPKVEPPKVEPSPDEESDEKIFYLSRFIKKLGRKVNAQMKITPTGFKVLAGSEISPDENPTLYAVVKKARRSAKIDANGILLEDMECKTSTMAGMFVMGNKVGGPTEWQTRDGEPLKNFL